MHFSSADELFWGYSALAIIAAAAGMDAFRIFRRKRAAINGADRVLWFLQGGIALVLVLPMLLRLLLTQSWLELFTSGEMFEDLVYRQSLGLIAAGLLFAAGICWIARTERSHLRFLLILFLPMFLASRILFLIYVHSAPYSDFETMWNLVRQVAARHRLLLPGDYPNPGLDDLLYLRRILPIWSPLALAFGASAWVYRISNVLMQLASGLIAYFLANRYFGRRAAQICGWLLLSIPELLLSTGIPTHDLAGGFLLMLFLFCYDRLLAALQRTAMARALGWSLAAGLFWLATDIQRDLGLFITAAMLLFAAVAGIHGWLEERNSKTLATANRILFLFIIPFLAYRVVGAALVNAGLYRGREQSTRTTYLFTTLDNPDGSFVRMTGIRDELLAAEERGGAGESPAFWNRFYGNAVLSEYYYNLWRYVPQLVNRTGLLFGFGAGRWGGFYISRLAPDSPLQPKDWPIRFLKYCDPLFSPLFLAAAIASLLTMLGAGGWRPEKFPPLVLLATMLFIILCVAEVQPRYAYPAWLIMPIYIGGACDRRLGRAGEQAFDREALRGGAEAALASGCLLFLAAMGSYSFAPGKLFFQRDWNVETSGGPSIPGKQGGKNADGWVETLNRVRVSTCLPRQPEPGDWVRALHSTKGLDPAKKYFVLGEVFAPNVRFEAGNAEWIELEVAVNGTIRLQLKGAELNGARFIALHGVQPTKEGKIELRIETNALAANADPQWRTLSTIQLSRFCLIPEP